MILRAVRIFGERDDLDRIARQRLVGGEGDRRVRLVTDVGHECPGVVYPGTVERLGCLGIGVDDRNAVLYEVTCLVAVRFDDEVGNSERLQFVDERAAALGERTDDCVVGDIVDASGQRTGEGVVERGKEQHRKSEKDEKDTGEIHTRLSPGG